MFSATLGAHRAQGVPPCPKHFKEGCKSKVEGHTPGGVQVLSAWWTHSLASCSTPPKPAVQPQTRACSTPCLRWTNLQAAGESDDTRQSEPPLMCTQAPNEVDVTGPVPRELQCSMCNQSLCRPAVHGEGKHNPARAEVSFSSS